MSFKPSIGHLIALGLSSLRADGVTVTVRRAKKYIGRHFNSAAPLALGSAGMSAPSWDQSYDLTSEDGTVPARRTHSTRDFAIKVPFPEPDLRLQTPIGVFVHAYYPDLLDKIVPYLNNISHPLELLVTTDTNQKADLVRSKLEGLGHPLLVAVTPNRGRDIAPKFIAFAERYKNYEIVLHLHTKRSPHSDGLNNWLQYLLQNLLGSREIVDSNLSLFRDERLGMVFPQHFPELRGVLNWGYDYEQSQKILSTCGIYLSKDYLLEFPSGSMFWARAAALRPILDLKLDYTDFPVEAGQIDGTLAHAIERSFLFFLEAKGYYWLKVHDGESYPWPSTLLNYQGIGREHVLSEVHQPLMINRMLEDGPLARSQPTLRPLRPTISRSKVPRLNLLLPSLNARSVFGGAATAINVFHEIADHLNNFDLRIITLDAALEEETVKQYRQFVLADQDCDNRRVLFDAFDRTMAVSLREGDVFISTAWWSEIHRRSLLDVQKRHFGRVPTSIYLIQDYEPNFSKWSSSWALAESTYTFDDSCYPLFNSEELYNFFENRYKFKPAMYLPFRINRTISGGLTSKTKAKTLLFYGRPSVERNCFETLIDGLAMWQQREPLAAKDWRIVSLGESYPSSWCFPARNVTVRGKVSLTEYSQLLSEASVGVSLMVSPHPSYPPLEMAAAGLITVSNNYDNKRIADRSPNIIGIETITPESVAAAIGQAVDAAGRATVGQLAKWSAINDLPCQGAPYDAEQLADIIRSSVESAFAGT